MEQACVFTWMCLYTPVHLYTYIYVPVGIEVYMVLSDTPKQNKTAAGKWYPAAQVIFMHSFSSGPNEFGFA